MSNESEPLDEVGEALTLTVDVIEDAIADLKAATQEAVRDERFEEVERDNARLRDLRVFTDDVAALVERWQVTAGFGSEQLAAATAKEQDQGTGAGKRYFGRVPRGKKTPEAAFREPILRLLVAAGGSLQAAKCLDQLEDVMADRLNDVDRESLRSDRRTLRWRNTAQWSRNTLVDQGLIDRSVRGVWTVTSAGRKWLERRS